MQRVKIMLPAYNEEQSLPSLLKRIDSLKTRSFLSVEVLVVNDGSKDDTLKVAQNFKGNIKIQILDLQPNRGLAGAMREGFIEAVKEMDEEDILITMDADDSHHPGLIVRMVAQINEGSDIVIASRYRPGSRIIGLSKFREILSMGAGIIFRVLKPIIGVRDYTCGYRAYRVSFLKKSHQFYQNRFIEQQGFGCMAEILFKMNRFKPVIHELPFILRYDLKRGASKMKVRKTIHQTLSMVIKKY